MTDLEQNEIFDSWLKQYKALLFKVVRTYAKEAFDVDDLFQEVVYQVWRSIPNFRNESKVSTWLYRVSLNTALRWNRKVQKVNQERQDFEHVQHLLEVNNEPIDERLIWIYDEISKLEKIDRSITLLMLDGFSYKEMAEILGISESNIGVKIHRIKKHLIYKSKAWE